MADGSAKTLYYVWQTGCGACEEATPALKAFARAHPEIQIIKVDLAVFDWPDRARFQPEGTPTYVAVKDGKRVAPPFVGKMDDLQALEAWALRSFGG